MAAPPAADWSPIAGPARLYPARPSDDQGLGRTDGRGGAFRRVRPDGGRRTKRACPASPAGPTHWERDVPATSPSLLRACVQATALVCRETGP